MLFSAGKRLVLRGSTVVTIATELHATSFGSGESIAGAAADESTLLLGEGGVDVEHERVHIRTQLGDNEGNAMLHQAGDVGDIAAEPIELGDDHRAAELLAQRYRLSQLRTVLVAAAALDLHEALGQLEALGLGKTA